MLSYQTVNPDTLELLRTLMSQPEMQGLRLVGGTSLALQYGHRQSIYLDFFGKLQVSQDAVVDMISRLDFDYKILNRTEMILQLVVCKTKVDIIDYHYDWIDKPVVEDDITLASPKDIAALKINAIKGRGSKKNFIDIYLLLQHYSLDEILCFYASKYPNHSMFMALKSLIYFEDAEKQTMPKMFTTTTWDSMKKFIIKAVNEYQNKASDIS